MACVRHSVYVCVCVCVCAGMCKSYLKTPSAIVYIIRHKCLLEWPPLFQTMFCFVNVPLMCVWKSFLSHNALGTPN